MRGLSEKQWAAIAILSQPQRGGLTYAEVAKEVGVARSTIYEWKKNERFEKALKDEIVRNTIDRLPDVLESVPEHVIKSGNAAMLRTFLQMHGLLTEKHEVETKGDGGADIDAMKAEVARFKGRDVTE